MLTYKIYENTNEEVNFCEQVESNDLLSKIAILPKKGVRVQKSTLVSERQEIPYRLRLLIQIKREYKLGRPCNNKASSGHNVRTTTIHQKPKGPLQFANQSSGVDPRG